METYKSSEIKSTVAFHDVDPTQVVWHGNYFKYFDMARFALFKESGVDLYGYYVRNQYIFPIVRTSTKHILPLKFDDEFICKATVIEAKIKITLDFEIRLARNNAICTRGRSDQVAVKTPEMEMQLEIPEEISKALGVD